MTATTTIIGNLTSDPKLSYTTAGAPVANGSIAINHRFQQAGQWRETTSFIKWAAFGQLAENIAASLSKGHQVVAVGHLETDNYETKAGQQRSELQLRVQHMAASLLFARVQVERVSREHSISAQAGEDDF